MKTDPEVVEMLAACERAIEHARKQIDRLAAVEPQTPGVAREIDRLIAAFERQIQKRKAAAADLIDAFARYSSG